MRASQRLRFNGREQKGKQGVIAITIGFKE